MALIGCLLATAVQISRYMSSTVWILASTTPIHPHNTACDDYFSVHSAVSNTVVLETRSSEFVGSLPEGRGSEYRRMKLIGGQAHHFELAVVTIVFPLKIDPAVFDVDETTVRDGHAMSVTTYVIEYLLWTGERTFGVDHPFDPLGFCHLSGRKRWLHEAAPGYPKNSRLPLLNAVCRELRNRRRNSRDRTRTGRKKSGLQEIHRLPSGDKPPRLALHSGGADGDTRAHNTLSTEATHVQVFYPFHPLHGSTLRVICRPKTSDGAVTA